MRAETRSLEMIYPDGVAYWRVIDGGFRPDSRIEFSYMRCVDPISGGRPVESGIAVVTSHLGTHVPAALVDGSTWAFDFPAQVQQFSTAPNEPRFPEKPFPIFGRHVLVVRFDAERDDLPLKATLGWALRDDGAQDPCVATRTVTLGRPWSQEAYFDPDFGAVELDAGGWVPARFTYTAFDFSILGTFEEGGGSIAFPKWRLRINPQEYLAGSYKCEDDPSYCAPCSDGSDALCMQYMTSATDVWRSPIPLVDRTAEEIALDPGCP